MSLFSSATGGHLKAELKDLTDEDFDLFRRLIYEQSGISLNDTKKELLRTRLRSRLIREGYRSYREYYSFIKKDQTGNAIVPLLDDISTNLTSFFREINHFSFLDTVIPKMIAEKEKKRDSTFRIWSAGCSSGEEVYSLLFTMQAHLKNKKPEWNLKMLATDISTDILQKASNGLYDVKRVDAVPPYMVKKYFVKELGPKGREMMRIKPEYRQIVTFRRFNLMTENFPFKHQFDYIFCRNVMIYFDKPTQEVLVSKYHKLLKPNGYLFIGHSESLTGLNHSFRYAQPTIYQK